MAHLEELTSYKQLLMQAICTNPEIVSLLKLSTDPEDITGRDMRYKRIFPYNYVPLVIEQASAFVCFSVVVPRIYNNVIAQYKLIIWIFAHQDIMKTKDGMRTDLLASKIDAMLNGSTKYGLGKVELQCCDIMNAPAKGYAGLYLEYAVEDFNRGCKTR